MSTDNTDKNPSEGYLYEDLTRQIIKAIFNVHNRLGYGYREKELQRALAEEFKKPGLGFVRELFCNLVYEGKVISKFYIDFVVEGKVVVELKIADDFYKKHFDQIMTYLKTNNLRLGLLAIYTKQKVLIKRVIN